jgi:spoIIIJ-associated protein
VTSDHNLSPTSDSETLPENVQKVLRFIRQVLASMGMQLRTDVSEADGIIHVNLTGPDRSLLLSGTAALLNSLEYLTNKAFRTGKNEPISSIQLDSDSYRQHREAELTLLAKMASQKVLSQHKPLVLQPMTPRERRIVHLALASIEGVRSESDGIGEQRSVTIYPKD